MVFEKRIGAAAMLLMAGCVAPESGGFTQPAGPAIALQSQWYPGERLTGYGTRSLQGQFYRSGTTPTGNGYTIFPDGSGGVETPVAKWTVACRKDKISDATKCKISNYDRNLFIDFGNGSAPKWVCVISHDFPGRVGAIRVDDKPARTTDEDGCVSGAYMSQLLAGSSVTTRAVKWPYDYGVDDTGSLDGLAAAIALMKFINSNLAKMNFG